MTAIYKKIQKLKLGHDAINRLQNGKESIMRNR